MLAVLVAKRVDLSGLLAFLCKIPGLHEFNTVEPHPENDGRHVRSWKLTRQQCRVVDAEARTRSPTVPNVNVRRCVIVELDLDEKSEKPAEFWHDSEYTQKIMGRKLKPASQKQTILIPLRVKQVDHRRAVQAAELSHLPLAVFAKVATLDRAAAVLRKAG